jgi:transcriptional regulator with XRE-family HTH domain
MRNAAGLSQTELARQIGYGRTHVSNAENHRRLASAEFWEACDDVLGADGRLRQVHGQIAAARAGLERELAAQRRAHHQARARAWRPAVPAPVAVDVGPDEAGPADARSGMQTANISDGAAAGEVSDDVAGVLPDLPSRSAFLLLPTPMRSDHGDGDSVQGDGAAAGDGFGRPGASPRRRPRGAISHHIAYSRSTAT